MPFDSPLSRVALALAFGLCSIGCSGDATDPATCISRTPFRGERFTIQSITTGNPPQPSDFAAVRGRLTMTVNVDTAMVPPTGGRVELWSGGRLHVAVPVARSDGAAQGHPDYVGIMLSLDSAVLPNGQQSIEALLVAGSAPSTVCGANSIISRLSQSLITSNP